MPLGESTSWDGSRRVCGWTKADFVDYYADKETGEPSSWYFHSQRASWNVLYYSPDTAVRNTDWFRPPEYCTLDQDEDTGAEGSRRRTRQKGGNKDKSDVNAATIPPPPPRLPPDWAGINDH